MFSHTCDNYLQNIICASHPRSFTTAHLFCTSVQMAYHHLNNEFSSVFVLFENIIKYSLKHSKDRKGNFPRWDSNLMPLVCQTSTLTAGPQRIPNLSQITYPSDSCSVMPVTIIYSILYFIYIYIYYVLGLTPEQFIMFAMYIFFHIPGYHSAT